MGMYTTLKLKVLLKPIAEIGEAHKWLPILLYHEGSSPDIQLEHERLNINPDRPKHPFWHTERFTSLGYGSFNYDTGVQQYPVYAHPVLEICATVNHGREEIEKFLSWLTPYVQSISDDPEWCSWHSEHQDYDDTTQVKWLKATPESEPQFALETTSTRAVDFCGCERYARPVEWIQP